MTLAVLALLLAPASTPVAATAPLRRECFVLEQPLAAGSARAVGWAEFLRRENEHGMVLECEYVFLRPTDGERWRVRHLEQLDERGPRLVWREFGTASGRTLTLERERESDAWHCQAWERSEVVQSSIDTQSGALLPLYLLELARQGHLGASDLYVFDPLESALVPRRATSVYQPASGSRTRTLELARRDGTLAGRFVFEQSELVAFEWQEGGARARRIAPEEYQRATAPDAPAACSDSAK